PVERLGIPGGVMQKVVERLPVGSGHDGGEFDERLVVLARQQQPNQVLAQRSSFLVAGEEVVKRRAKRVNRLRRAGGGLPRSAHRTGSSPARTPVSFHPTTFDQPALGARHATFAGFLNPRASITGNPKWVKCTL